jgi:uncharacterized protein
MSLNRRRVLALVAATLPTTASASPRKLLRAARAGDVATVERLLNAGTPVDTRDATGRTALLLATQADRQATAALLIARGADVNAKDRQAESPFLSAAALGHLEILRLTLAAGADVSSTNRHGSTALIAAAEHGHVEAVRELLQTRIDISLLDRRGRSALLQAVIAGDGGTRYAEIVRLLLVRGVSPEQGDASGLAPLAHAEQRGQVAVAALLRAASLADRPSTLER